MLNTAKNIQFVNFCMNIVVDKKLNVINFEINFLKQKLKYDKKIFI